MTRYFASCDACSNGPGFEYAETDFAAALIESVSLEELLTSGGEGAASLLEGGGGGGADSHLVTTLLGGRNRDVRFGAFVIFSFEPAAPIIVVDVDAVRESAVGEEGFSDGLLEV